MITSVFLEVHAPARFSGAPSPPYPSYLGCVRGVKYLFVYVSQEISATNVLGVCITQTYAQSKSVV